MKIKTLERYFYIGMLILVILFTLRLIVIGLQIFLGDY